MLCVGECDTERSGGGSSNSTPLPRHSNTCQGGNIRQARKNREVFEYPCVCPIVLFPCSFDLCVLHDGLRVESVVEATLALDWRRDRFQPERTTIGDTPSHAHQVTMHVHVCGGMHRYDLLVVCVYLCVAVSCLFSSLLAPKRFL